MVALWVKEQSAGRSRIVLFGKPSGLIDPLRSGRRGRRGAAACTTQRPADPTAADASARGGHRGSGGAVAAAPCRPAPPADRASGRRPDRAVRVRSPVSARCAGSLPRSRLGAARPYVTTSRRTPRAMVEALRAQLPPGGPLFEWTPDHRQSLSCPARPGRRLHRHRRQRLDDGRGGARAQTARDPGAAARPVAAIDQVRRGLLRRLFHADGGRGAARGCRGDPRRLLAATRDFRAFHQMLFDAGLAVRAGEPSRRPRAPCRTTKCKNNTGKSHTKPEPGQGGSGQGQALLPRPEGGRGTGPRGGRKRTGGGRGARPPAGPGGRKGGGGSGGPAPPGS